MMNECADVRPSGMRVLLIRGCFWSQCLCRLTRVEMFAGTLYASISMRLCQLWAGWYDALYRQMV